MSEPGNRLASALLRLRLAALRRFARRLGVPLTPETAQRLLGRFGPAGSAAHLSWLARLPAFLRPLWLRLL